MSGPLQGLRVLDLTWGMVGSVTSMFFADYGADVVKVAAPDGGLARARATTVTWDRGKRSLLADLRDTDYRRLVVELAVSADVILTGLRPDALAAFGLDPATVTARNPNVVYCSIFGDRDDPAGPCGHPILAAARLGVVAESPGYRDGPIFPAHPSYVYATAMVAAIGVLASLRRRLRTGAGNVFDVSFTEGVLALSGQNWWSERGASAFAGKTRSGQLDFGRSRVPGIVRMFECADGGFIQLHTGAVGAFDRAMEVFGLGGMVSKAAIGQQADTPLTDDDLEAMRAIPDIIRGEPTNVWLERLWANEVACLPVQAPTEAYRDEQVVHAGLIVRLDDPELGSLEVVGPVIKFDATPGEVRRGAPLVGEDTDHIRTEGWQGSGFPAATEGATPDPALLPLDGIRILDLGSWFASPYGNRLLLDLGAEVVKVEGLGGDPLRGMPDPAEGAMRGKRSIALDLKGEGAAEVLQRLIAWADVVQHNNRPGVAERLGYDVATARRHNPEVVYCYAPGYGSTGPKSRLQSFAPLLSGFVGVNVIAAGEGNPPNGAYGNEDYYNGLLSAVAILMAMLHRERTGEGQYVEVPQLHSSLLFCSEWYLKDGTPRSAVPVLDHDQTGWGPLYRLYQCLDVWLAVACVHDDDVRAFMKAIEPDLDVPHATLADCMAHADQVAAEIQYRLFHAPAAEWCEQLGVVGVPTEVVREESWLNDFLLDDANIASGRVWEVEHPTWGRVRTVRPFARVVQGAVSSPPLRSPLLGEQTREVLDEVGFTPAEVDELFARGVVGERTL
jgi:crotonobetainyl-CoA:carnitine CoA-transferase CaiB-like acyl-CoA transferase